MKFFYATCFTLLLLFGHIDLSAQQTDIPVRFASGDFFTGNNIQKQRFQTGSLQASLFNNKYYVLVQFEKLPTLQQRTNLRNSGLELGTWYPGNAYLATVTKEFDFAQAANFSIVSVNQLPSIYKIDPAIANFKAGSSAEKVFAVSLFPSISREAAVASLQSAGAVIVETKFNNGEFIFIRPTDVGSIAALPFVGNINLQSLTDKLLNYQGVGLHAAGSVQSASGRYLTGKGATVGIGDNSEILSTHIDFNDRVITRHPFPVSFHGVHVSGTVGGAGLLNPKYSGMGPKATIISQWLSDVIINTPTYAVDNNMTSTNNSYTAADDSCAGTGVYDALSNYTDNQMRNFEKVLHVVSAGNDGEYKCSPYDTSFATVKSGFQSAKNVLTVGAIDQSNYSIADFSSRGPVKDGRIKPEIVASGVNVYSTAHIFRYGLNNGTSMSGPMVAGATTLLNEQYRKTNGGLIPKASLIKALLCNTAEDLGNPGPDFTFGFGMLNVRRAVEAIENNSFFISSTTPSLNTIAVPAGVRRLKVMLYWADTAAAPNAASTLINDLDLTVTAPGPVTHLPLILDATAANVNLNAAQGVDRINNIEQVVIENPAAGNYDINVAAFALPYGPQEYVITYQMDMNGVTVEYPFGGEKLVPGETETIRWNAYGDEGNTFTIEYFDGTSWNLINNAVAVTERSFNWIVPATISNNYLIRVSRNSSAYNDESDFVFSVIGQPVLQPELPAALTIPCEGFVQLDWNAVTGSTSYDIWQQKGDSMAIIGNTTSLSYLISGLNSSTTYWFGVSAKNGSINGRRSVSRSALPATGVCTLSNFDNNFKAVSIDAPVTKRQFTSDVLTAAEQIRLTIKNLDNIASAGSYDLYYQINNDPAVMESNATVINSLATYQYVFAATADFSSVGTYIIKAWVKRTGDIQSLDDTVTITIKNLANPVLTLPEFDGFESTTEKTYTKNTLGFEGNDKIDFKTNSVRGRARTYVNTGFALNGSRAVTLDQHIYNAALTTDSLLMTYNLSNYVSGNQLRLDFYYKNHGQDNNPNNRVWIRGDDTKAWVEAYNLVANQAALGQWKHANININDVLGPVIPAQPISSSFQIKFGEQGSYSANVPYPYLDQDDGYTFDDVSLTEAVNDIGILNIVSPSVTGCGVSAATSVSLNIKNYSSSTFTNVPVYYSVNGGAPVMENIASLTPGTTAHSFAVPENLLIDTDYSFDFWVNEPTDTYNANDSILNYAFRTSPVISSFPYLEGFESGAGSWYSRGSNNSWQWGSPSKTIINKAANGINAWTTSLTATYNNNELSYLYSPCFDLSGLTQPVLSFSHIFKLDNATDYTWVEYSTDGGITWMRLGTGGSGTNWYNDPSGKKQWRPSLQTWHVASNDIPTTGSNVRFRFVMSSDLGFNFEGVGIDDIHIFDKALIYTGTTVTGITQAVSGSSWTHFVTGGRRVASINANGNNMGSTSVSVYPVTGAIRISNGQYYLNRNIVIQPTTPPATDVTVRYYFSDAEAKSLLAATGCGNCTKPGDPYELGVTKYSGLAAEENGTLADNFTGIFTYILPSNTEIIPYDNGYYAEFSVSSFSEFWLNDGGNGNTHPLPINLLSFEAIKQNKRVELKWATDNELNVDRYVVERSSNGVNFTTIGSVYAFNNSNQNNYNLVDNQPLSGLNLYRLKMYDKDGTFRYSPIRKINFDNAGDDISIYPNPVVDTKILVSSSANATTAVLYDATGRVVKSFRLNGRNNTLDVNGVSAGAYQLKVITENSINTSKIIIQ